MIGDVDQSREGRLVGAGGVRPVVVVVMEPASSARRPRALAIRDFHDRTGRLTPEWFRLGASSLLNDCLMQLAKQRTGRYQSADYFTKD
jgi:hypothetical protein